MIRRILKKLALKYVPEFKNISELLQSQSTNVLTTLNKHYGYDLSVKKGRPIDIDGNPIPWFTYSAIEYLSQLNLSEKTVLEWGSGNSSLFFAKRVKSIVSIESDNEWYKEISDRKLQNQEVLFSKIENYEKIPSLIGKKFDIVIVDGKKRYECSKEVSKFLNDGGIVILDNSDWYKNSAKEIRNIGLIQVDFSGIGPINSYIWTTSIFFTRDCKFITDNNVQPHSPKGGINNICD
jgi:tRNA(Met) C34 N-acetyltransferase TmcA